jgi:hypothetical protein
MKRDLDLIRTILLTIEENSPIYSINAPKDMINYQLDILGNADYINLKVERVQGQKAGLYQIYGMTEKGHNYLDVLRKDNVWCKFKEKAGDMVESIPLEIVKTMCIEIVKEIIINR